MKAGFQDNDSYLISEYQGIRKLIEQSVKFMLLCDTNTFQHCSELFLKKLGIKADVIYSIKPGESNKNLRQVEILYEVLLNNNFDRHSIIVNLGGGIVGDLGGYAAATYKRGITFVNVPTTLLAMVDAAHGGKTGVNFKGIKNQIGSFYKAQAVLIDLVFLKSLDKENILSGFAEMIKHTLISDSLQWEILKNLNGLETDQLSFDMIESSIKIKNKIVESDPLEKSERKKLNFGHSIGHAFESFLAKKGKEISHGRAVAAGMTCEVLLSLKRELNDSEAQEIIGFLDQIYGRLELKTEDVEEIIKLMYFDKKNKDGKLNFTLLSAIGTAVFDQYIDEAEVRTSLKHYIQGK